VTPARLYLKHFDVPFETIRVKLADINLEIDPEVIPNQESGIFSFGVTVPKFLEIGVMQGIVYVEGDGTKISAFKFTVLAPPTQIEPVDGSIVGASIVTVTAHWGAMGTERDIKVTFGNVAGKVQATLMSNSASSAFAIVTPPGMIAGIVQAELQGLAGAVALFNFEYYDPPVFADVQPRVSTLDGRVGECNGCLLDNDGRHLNVWVENFPPVYSATDFEITIGSHKCDGTVCAVKTIKNLVGKLFFTVSVPAAQSRARVAMSLRYTGMPIPPHPAVTPSGNVRREDKTAVSSAVGIFLEYVKPLPVVVLAQFCSNCNAGSSCIDGGMCGMNESPLIARAMSSQIPLSIVLPQVGGGVLTLSVSELPGLLVSAGQLVGGTLSVIFGDRSGTIKRVLWSSVSETRLEVVLPEQGSFGRMTVTVTMLSDGGTKLQAAFLALIVDDSISVRCAASGSNLCAGPSDRAHPVLLNLTDFPPVDQAELNSQVRVRVGLVTAVPQLITSAGPHGTMFIVEVPSCSGCTFQNGLLSELMSIEIFSPADKAWNVLTAVLFSYVAPPSVSSVRFTNAGSGLEVYFDSPTNRGGFKQATVFDCNEILTPVGLGTSPTCMWQNAQSLAVTFGGNPTVLPGDSLMLKSDAIKSLDGISPSALSEQRRAEILAPAFQAPLGPVIIRASSQIDTCANLILSASVVSPRPLVFTWRCITSEGLDVFLRSQTGSNIVLSRGTVEMDQVDWKYVITVTATDFMGITSAIASHTVTKKTVSMPQFTLTGMPLYQVSDDVLLRADAQFSQCPIAQTPLVFEWSDLSAGDKIPAYLLNKNKQANSAHFFIPASTLKSGTRYTVQVAASMMSEPYRRSESVFDIFIDQAPLLAVIDGGSVQTVSKLKHFSLDGKRSRDLGMVRLAPSYDGALPAVNDGLSYKWTCSILTLPCRSDISQEVISFANKGSIRVQAGTLAVSMNVPYQFTLTVSKGTRTHSTVSALYVHPNPIPAIGISNNIAHVDDLGIPKINALDRLMFYGFSDSPDTRFSWSISPSVPLPASVAPLGSAHETLVLVPTVSQPITVPGGTYVLKLEGTTPGGSGSAQITVVVNAPPQPGSCNVCKVSSKNECLQSGRSLVDLFKIECSLWSDENQPLQYRYGIKSPGFDTWWSSLGFGSVKQVMLPSGSIEVSVEIVDNLGASAMSVTQTVLLSSFARRFLTDCIVYQPILDNVDSAISRSRADEINQFASALAHEMGRVGASACTEIRSKLVDALEQGIAAAASTTDFAEEAGDALSAVTSQPCGLTVDSALSSLALVKQLASVDTRGRAIKTTLGKSLVNTISSSIGSSAAGMCSASRTYTTDQAKTVMNLKVDAASLVMMASLRQKLVGEPSVKTQAEFTSQLAERTTLRKVSASAGGVKANRRLSAVASGAAFVLNSTIASQIGLADASQAIDIFRSDDDLMEGVARQLSAIAFMSSVAVGFKISTAGSTTHLKVQNLSTPIDVIIPVDPSKTAQDLFWKQKVNCAWYDTIDGVWSFSGCERYDVSDLQIHCKCNHLTQFAIAIDPAVVICGDGQRRLTEECDDGNKVDNDGCSASCKVEPGAFCDVQSPSVCLQACPPGQYLAGYKIQVMRIIVKGACTDCPALEYKSAAENYATTCTPLTLCPAGREKKWFPASLMGRTDGTCVPCKKGFYKPSNPEGSPLDQCTRCPGFSITTVQGSHEERDCRCDGISRIQSSTSATIDCVYADSCGMSPGACVADATCSFSNACGTKCKCPAFHHGNGFIVGALVFDVFYGAITGTGCTSSGNNATARCDPDYFGGQCEYKMPIGTVFSYAVKDADANGVVDPFSLQGFFNGVEVASIDGPAGFLPTSYVENTRIDISVLMREDLDLLNPGLSPDPSWMRSNLSPTDTRYECAPTGASLAADFILKLKPAGLSFAVPVQLRIDAEGVPGSDPPRYKHVMLFDEGTNTWTPLGKGTLSDKVSAPLEHFSLYASGAGAEVERTPSPPSPPPLPPPSPGIVISDLPSKPTGNSTAPPITKSESSTGVLIAAIVVPFICLMGAAALFIYRKRIIGNVFLNKIAPEDTELSIMQTPLNMEARGNDEPGARGPDIPEVDASNSRPLSAPLTADLIVASGVKLNEWNSCRSCQVSIYI
jgi:cysteine-rich repeat protein